jgi:hypothetical protein
MLAAVQLIRDLRRQASVQAHRLPRHASFNGSGLMATYLVVFAMLAWPMSFWSLQASIPPLACTVPVVCRKQCGWTGKSISALRLAVAIILLMANRLNRSPRSLVKM